MRDIKIYTQKLKDGGTSLVNFFERKNDTWYNGLVDTDGNERIFTCSDYKEEDNLDYENDSFFHVMRECFDLYSVSKMIPDTLTREGKISLDEVYSLIFDE